MAGHSHSANIAIRKGAQDKKRAKLFSKLAKEIIVACKMGDPDPDSNPRLRLALRKARAQSLPKNTIERAIKKGSGELEGEDYQELIMEGYGPGGTAVYIEVLTDNRNRAASEIRHAFTKGGGNLGTTGCVGYMFNRKGVIVVQGDEDEVMLAALDAGADDILDNEDGTWEILTEPSECEAVLDALDEASLTVKQDQVIFIPDNRVSLDGKSAQQLLRMLDMLDDCDDVQGLTHNADIPKAAIEAFANS
ncbi:MAG TPA: YebC/PmpR family DNA-binding transcriptional regulator [Myxococcales bacterium]|nr:YebC/PmpR family DNA-binding transcriptional regulator [Myxococcales bacterium]HAN31292.1 YebC/PmpR family DNA-binding transcriptional regulator [Myxococcales bacterium]